MIELPPKVRGPKVLAKIEIVLLGTGQVLCQINPTPPEYVVRGMLDQAKDELVAAIRKNADGIEVAPSGMAVERTGD